MPGGMASSERGIVRKSTLILLATGLTLAVILGVLFAAVMGLSILLTDVVGPDASYVVFLGLSLALVPALIISLIVYVRRTAHKSWKVNTSLYPGVKAGIDLYRDDGEDVRRLLPAFLVDGRRYFLVKYVRRNEEWAPEGETGMVVLDEQGTVNNDESLFRNLLRSVRYVEDSFRFPSLQGQEDVMAAGRRMDREIAEARSFFSQRVPSAGDPELMEHVEKFLTPLAEQMERMASLTEGEYRWCQRNWKRVEFTLEEMKPLQKAREEASAWLTENAGRIAQAWARLDKHKAKLENLPELSPHDRTRLRNLLGGLHAATKAMSDVDNFRMQVSPRRVDAFRTRTAKALGLNGEAQRSSNVL